MMDKEYWKEAYKELWPATCKKEDSVKELIENATGFKVDIAGLGAGTNTFLPGNAADYGLKKGDADLYIADADAYIEVTGPNIPVSLSDALWIRPDKVQNSYHKWQAGTGKLHAIVHVARIKQLDKLAIRVILLSGPFFDACLRQEFNIINPFIRGRKEKYLEIPSSHPTIITFKAFIGLLKQVQQ